MSIVLKAIALLSLITLMVPYCHGVLVPKLNGKFIGYMFTPYKDNGDVNLDVVPRLAEFVAERNVKNVYIMGFFGEGPLLPLKDRKALTSAWVKETDRLGLNLIVQVGGMPFPDQLKMAKYCSQINVSAITAFPLLVYEADTAADIVEDYQRLSDAAPNLSLIYDSYSETGPRVLPAEAFVALMGRVKTFAGGILSIDNALDVKAAVPSIEGYQIWIYGNRAIAPALAANMNASQANIANLCPKVALAIESAVDERNYKLAFDLQQQTNRLVQAIVNNNGEIIDFRSRPVFRYLKAASRMITGIDFGARLPIEKATAAEFDRIRSNLAEYQDFINCYCN